MALKAKVFTYRPPGFAGGLLHQSPLKIEEALNEFIQQNNLSEKEITSVTQSETNNIMLTMTFLYKE